MIHIMIGKPIKERLAKELKRAQAQNNAQVYRRVAVLICYANEIPNEEICKIFNICESTIYLPDGRQATGLLNLSSKGLSGLPRFLKGGVGSQGYRRSREPN